MPRAVHLIALAVLMAAPAVAQVSRGAAKPGGVTPMASLCGTKPPAIACNTWVCTDGSWIEQPVANGTSCNDSNACTYTDRCQAGSCVGTPISCVSTNPCQVLSCNGTSTCASANAPSTKLCRAAATGTCQADAYCTGASTACPANPPAPAGKVCRTPQAACQGAASCSGSSTTCPANPALPVGSTCSVVPGLDVACGCTAAMACQGKGPDVVTAFCFDSRGNTSARYSVAKDTVCATACPNAP